MLVLLVVVLLFGTGRISSVMGDFAKGLKAFKKNMADDSDVSMEASERPAGSIAAPAMQAQAQTQSYASPVSPPYAAPVTPPAAALHPAPPVTAAAPQPAQPTTVDHA
jgi:sec-independent protein translocase protein TatA